MGRAEGNSSAGAIAVIVIAGVSVLALFGCGGLAAMGWLLTARSAPMPASVAPSPAITTSAVLAPISITLMNDAVGLAVIDGTTYSDDELRQKLAVDAGAGLTVDQVTYEFTPDLAPDRRAALEQIVAESLTVTPAASP